MKKSGHTLGNWNCGFGALFGFVYLGYVDTDQRIQKILNQIMSQ
jgi:hypothetical protein